MAFTLDRHIMSFETLVHSTDRINPYAKRIHGIGAESLGGAPPVERVLARFRRFCKGAVLVEHSADAFDTRLIASTMETAIDADNLDTSRMAGPSGTYATPSAWSGCARSSASITAVLITRWPTPRPRRRASSSCTALGRDRFGWRHARRPARGGPAASAAGERRRRAAAGGRRRRRRRRPRRRHRAAPPPPRGGTGSPPPLRGRPSRRLSHGELGHQGVVVGGDRRLAVRPAASPDHLAATQPSAMAGRRRRSRCAPLASTSRTCSRGRAGGGDGSSHVAGLEHAVTPSAFDGAAEHAVDGPAAGQQCGQRVDDERQDRDADVEAGVDAGAQPRLVDRGVLARHAWARPARWPGAPAPGRGAARPCARRTRSPRGGRQARAS